MTYEETLEFVREAGKSGSILGLESIRRLMAELSDVQEEIPIIHIGGTNGKGSVGAYLAAIFREAGLHVGRYCSPAVFDPLEVWQYDGKNISKQEYAHVMSQVKMACDIMLSKGYGVPTAFEIETAAAFLYFAEKKPDVVLLEVGMGGETDATNLIRRPLASVLVSISRDHMQFLGESVLEIAGVKAGIIKPGCPVFSAPQQEEVQRFLQERAEALGCPITFVQPEFLQFGSAEPGKLKFSYSMSMQLEDGPSSVFLLLETAMAGHYQMENAALAVEVAAALLPKLLREHTAEEAISLEQMQYIIQGIKKARWPGRFEVVCGSPLIILDGAHNEGAAAELAKTIENCFTNPALTYIIGVLADKEYERMLQILLPYAKRVYTVTPENPRALEGRVLAEQMAAYWEKADFEESTQEKAVFAGSVEEALWQALSHPEPILAFGSLSWLGEVKKFVEENCNTIGNNIVEIR